MAHLHRFSSETSGPGLYEFTREVARWLPAEDGVLTHFVRHTRKPSHSGKCRSRGSYGFD